MSCLTDTMTRYWDCCPESLYEHSDGKAFWLALCINVHTIPAAGRRGEQLRDWLEPVLWGDKAFKYMGQGRSKGENLPKICTRTHPSLPTLSRFLSSIVLSDAQLQMACNCITEAITLFVG